ncbi:ABC transporter permease [Bacteroidales bacterium]|nr:ABC transporter permease [Bacteroidales bacterium]
MILKLAIRNLLKQRQTTTVNIVGLTVAVCAVFFLAAWVIQEFSYDRHHSNAERVYRLSIETGSKENNNYWHFARTHQQWRSKLPEFFPEVEELVELSPARDVKFTIGEESFYARGFGTKSNLFTAFDIEMVQGNQTSVFKDVHSVIISESWADKYFKNLDPIGQLIEGEGENFDTAGVYKVTGVFKDIPLTSHFHTDFFVHVFDPQGMNKMKWAYSYILLKEGASITDVNNKLPDFIETHVPKGWHTDNLQAINFTPLLDIHLKSHIEREIEPNGDMVHVKLIVFISIGLILIALINFSNLLTASFGKKMAGFTINRILGGRGKHNITMLVCESGIIGLTAILTAAILFRPLYEILYRLGVIGEFIFSSQMILTILVIGIVLLLTVCVSGILPYFLIKTKRMVAGTNNSLSDKSMRNLNSFHKPLLVVQFAISILVIVGGIMLNKQNKHMFNQNLGRDDSNIIVIDRNVWGDNAKISLLKDVMEKNPNVKMYCATMEQPTYHNKDARQVKSSYIPGGFTDYTLTITPTDANLFDFYDIPLVAGRHMSRYIPDQKFEEYIVNESAVKRMGFSNPEDVIGIDFTVRPFFDNLIQGGKIVGVVKDFHYASLYHPIQPTTFFQKPIWHGHSMIRFYEGNLQEQIASIKKDWHTVFPDAPFGYEMLTQIYEAAYDKDILLNKLLNLFSILCVLVSSIGLLGISSVLLLNKTKEIGVRKVNGAQVKDLLAMLNKDFVIWVFVAFVVACPLAFYLVKNWLENFASRTQVSWWVFAIAGAFAMIIAVVTVSIQSWKTASRNPVEALRYE